MIMHNFSILGKDHSLLSMIENHLGLTHFDQNDVNLLDYDFSEMGSFGDIAGFGIFDENAQIIEFPRIDENDEYCCKTIELAQFRELERDQALCGDRMLTCENAWLAMILDVFAAQLHLLEIAAHNARSNAQSLEMRWRPGDLEDIYKMGLNDLHKWMLQNLKALLKRGGGSFGRLNPSAMFSPPRQKIDELSRVAIESRKD